MTGLLRAEIRRFTSRRLMRILAVVSLALLVLVLARIAMLSRVHTEQPFQPPASVVEQGIAACEQDKANGTAPADLDCTQIFGNGPGGFEPYTVDQRVHARSHLYGGVLAVTVVVLLVTFIAAGSFVGAEWHAGTMQALLFWEPRRNRVLFAKAAATVIVSVAFLAVMQLVTYAGTFLIAATRGTTEGATAGVHMSVLLLALRGALVVSVVSLFGFGLAGLTRITAAAGIGGFVYVIVENLGILQFRPGWERFVVTRNIAAVLGKKVPVRGGNLPPEAGEGFEFGYQVYTLTGVRGAVTLAIYLALLLGAFYYMFTRRDVT